MAKKRTVSHEKYEEKILKELNSFLRRELASPELQFVSFTKVTLNPDYSIAKISYDCLSPKDQLAVGEKIESLKGRLRKLLSEHLDVRHTPELKFYYDSQYEDEQRITELLNEKP